MKLISRNDKLWITFYHQSTRYRRSLDLDDTKANRKLATTKIIPEIIYKLNSGKFFENELKNKVPTVEEFMKISFEIHRHERKQLTQRDYTKRYELHIQKYFANKQLDKIKPSDLAKWQNKLLQTRSPKTVKTIRSVFQTMFEDAVFDDIIKINPFTKVKAPKSEEVRVKKPFSKEEIFIILENIPEKIRCFFAIGFFTGMRTGEIIALKWENIDFENANSKNKCNFLR